MANWIDATYVNTFLSAEVRSELFTDESGTPSITTMIEAGQSIVEAALRHAGYTPPTASANPDLKLATFGQFLLLAYARPSKALPVPQEQQHLTEMAEQIRTGDLQPKGLTRDPLGGVAGLEFTESDPDVDGAATQWSGRDDLADF